MKKAIEIFVLLLFSVCGFAQEPDWFWTTQAGGSSWDQGNGIAIDNNGNSYVIGNFMETAIFGSYTITSYGEQDVFVAKMDTNGNWLWAKQAGGSDHDHGYGIAIDNYGNSYMTGNFIGTATFGSYSITSNSSYDWDIFVAKMDVNGNWLWVNNAGGSDWDEGNGIAIDNNGNTYLTGSFRDTATFGSYTISSTGDRDIFAAKIDADGNWLWVNNAGGNFEDESLGIAIDNYGNSYMTGSFRDTASFDSYTLSSNGYSDIFVAKIDATGNWLWATKAGGNALDYCKGIALDDNSNSYVTGSFKDTATFGSYTLTCNAEQDIFVAKMDTDGNWLWATQANGSSNTEEGSGIRIDDGGNSYVTGKFMETAIFGSYSITSNGGLDIFVAKMDTNGNWLWATQAGGSNHDHGYGIAIDNYGNSYMTGDFIGTAIFGPYSINGSGNNDIFVAKLGNDTSVENIIIPKNMVLSNYPNPFNPTTTISFSIQNDSQVELSIFNIKGQKIKVLVQNEFTKGSHSVMWNGDDLYGNSVSSEIYLYKLKVNGKIEAVKKCLLLK